MAKASKIKIYEDIIGELKYCFFFILSFIVLIVGCGSPLNTFYEIPVEFRFPEKKMELLRTYSHYFIGKKFFLDPGHGGEDRNNIGFMGNAVEADVNLKVALDLRMFIMEAGGTVEMSRKKDTTAALKDRSAMANKSGADFFISIHHNATGEKKDTWTNYTSTYYHAKDSDYEFEPCQKDLAKYIQRDLAYAMRNSGGLGSFDGTYSDYNIYPGQGFSVLRLTKIPAVLVECGFTTSEFESGRIAIDEFNRIEAWGIFRGLCRYLANGIPDIQFIKKEMMDSNNNLNIYFGIRDSAGVDINSVNVLIDSVNYKSYNFNQNNNILSINYSSANYGEHIIRIFAANNKGNYAFPYYYNIFVENKMDR
jgi:N-acetylmuramoyl-L-alanine amidase